MSDNYGARCKSCDIGQPACCGLCTVCVSNLKAENAKLREAMTGWEGYAHKQGEYVDDMGEYFAALLEGTNEAG